MIKISSKSGFTLVEIMIVVSVVGIIGAIAGPKLVHRSEAATTKACIINLKKISRPDLTKNRKPMPRTPTMV